MFDTWVDNKPGKSIEFERYADDIACHCLSERQALWLKDSVESRFIECGLELHPKKTKIVYCRSQFRRGTYEHIAFDFLSYTFRPR